MTHVGSCSYFPALDGVRTLVLAVMGYRGSPLVPGGFFGVDVSSCSAAS